MQEKLENIFGVEDICDSGKNRRFENLRLGQNLVV